MKKLLLLIPILIFAWCECWSSAQEYKYRISDVNSIWYETNYYEKIDDWCISFTDWSREVEQIICWTYRITTNKIKNNNIYD